MANFATGIQRYAGSTKSSRQHTISSSVRDRDKQLT